MDSDTRSGETRVLALDIRPRRFGYVCMEIPDSILDLGVTKYGSARIAAFRAESFLERLNPYLLVLRQVTRNSSRDQSKTLAIQYAAWRFARRSAIRVVFVHERQLFEYFATRDAHTKHDVAMLLASNFPDLGWYLPQTRKPWEPEHRHMLVFDATSLIVAHLELLSR